MPDIQLEIDDRQECAVNHPELRERLLRVLGEVGRAGAYVSLVLVTDAEIHRVNREFLEHDWPTDVISFSYSDPGDEAIDGELVVSVETAARQSVLHGWSLQDELLLYCVHGVLHLCGYDDLTDEARPLMREREREILDWFGLQPTGLQH